MKELNEIEGIGEETITKLNSLNIYTLDDLRMISWKNLIKVSHIGNEKIIALYSEIGVAPASHEIDWYLSELENESTSSQRPMRVIFQRNSEEIDLSDYDPRQIVLSQYLEVDVNEIEDDGEYYSLFTFEHEGEMYAVGTETEAKQTFREYMEESLYNVDTDILIDHMGSYIYGRTEDIEYDNERIKEGVKEEIQKWIENYREENDGEDPTEEEVEEEEEEMLSDEGYIEDPEDFVRDELYEEIRMHKDYGDSDEIYNMIDDITELMNYLIDVWDYYDNIGGRFLDDMEYENETYDIYSI